MPTDRYSGDLNKRELTYIDVVQFTIDSTCVYMLYKLTIQGKKVPNFPKALFELMTSGVAYIIGGGGRSNVRAHEVTNFSMDEWPSLFGFQPSSQNIQTEASVLDLSIPRKGFEGSALVNLYASASA